MAMVTIFAYAASLVLNLLAGITPSNLVTGQIVLAVLLFAGLYMVVGQTIATPVIDAVRVPPSAWRTSQSTVTVRSPSRERSTTPRSERPTRRWISWVRPPIRPLVDSRWLRSAVARGSIAYSAVTQPVPVPRRCGGTRSCSGVSARAYGSGSRSGRHKRRFERAPPHRRSA